MSTTTPNMWKVAKKFTAVVSAVLVTFAGAPPANAFSLLGPFDTWQTENLGYNLSAAISPIPDIGGPMTLGSEYRWNTSVVVYGYDSSFLNFFGQKGVDAIEAAIKILNDLPAASQMSGDLSEFPMDTRKFNFQAIALGIRDVKSWALSMLLESMGLATPERYVFTLRFQLQPPPGPFYTVLRRSFDPVTFNPSSYINGTLYTYNVLQTHGPPEPEVFEAVEVSVDPLAPVSTSVVSLSGLQAGATDFRGSGTLLSPGLFYTGLTRDDAGAIRYLLRPGNLNVENFPTNSVVPTGGGASTSTGSPWLVAPGSTGAQAGTGQTGATQPGGAGQIPGAGGATGTNLVDLALRPGVDKIKFVRHDFDSLVGGSFTNTIIFTDSFLTNGAIRQQVIQQTMTRPDILFSAADLDVDPNGVPILIRRTITFQNNGAINSIAAPGTGGALAGPGVIQSGVEITFNNVGPFLLNSGNNVSEETASRGEVWGSFDSSTNAPVIFPSGISIQQLERQIRRKSGGTAWRIP